MGTLGDKPLQQELEGGSTTAKEGHPQVLGSDGHVWRFLSPRVHFEIL